MNKECKYLDNTLVLKVKFLLQGNDEENVKYISISHQPSTPKLIIAIANDLEVNLRDIFVKDVEVYSIDKLTALKSEQILYLSDNTMSIKYRYFMIFYKSERIGTKIAEGYILLITKDKYPSLKFIKNSIINTNKTELKFTNPLIKNIIELSEEDYFDFISNDE